MDTIESIFGAIVALVGTDMKMVFVVNAELKMGKGKIASQVAHAAFAACEESMLNERKETKIWKSQGCPKIVLKGEDKNRLKSIFELAKFAGLPVVKIHDAGRTQIDPGSLTVVAIGPASQLEINKITANLKLL